MQMTLRTFWNDLLRLGGIFSGGRAYSGPRSAQVYISNCCSENCPWCGMYSPFLKNKECTKENNRKFMDFSLIKNLVDEFSDIGTFRFLLFGHGEPLLHPKILDIVGYIKKTAMECTLATSGIPLDSRKAECLAKLGIHFGIGLHAANPSTWQEIFSKHSKDDFLRLIEIIRMINNTRGSKVTLAFVISSINYSEIVDFVNLAIKLGCYAVNFIPPLTFEGTEFLRLSHVQLSNLREQISIGQTLANKNSLKTNLRSTSLVSFSHQERDFSTEEIYHKIPCYIGWLRTYISIEGEVFPCCGAMNIISMGNVINKRFKEIWFSEKYDNFRQKGFCLSKRTNVFEGIGCTNCLEYYYNSSIHELLNLRFWRWKS